VDTSSASPPVRKPFSLKYQRRKPRTIQEAQVEKLQQAKTELALVQGQQGDFSPEARQALVRVLMRRIRIVQGRLRRSGQRRRPARSTWTTLKSWTGPDRHVARTYLPDTAILGLFSAIPVFELPHVGEACPQLKQWEYSYYAAVAAGRLSLKSAALRRLRADLGLPEEARKPPRSPKKRL
jgi:hypothetical protein